MSASTTTIDLVKAAQGGDQAACEQALQENAGLIWSVARRYFGQGIDPDDLYQLGCLGFLKSVRGFDESFGTQFSTYAVPKIAGEIRRYLRDDGMIKVSRSLKERARSVRASRETLALALGREPSLSEISEHCGIAPEDIAACELAVSPTESLQYETGEDGMTLESVLSLDSCEETITENLALRQAIEKLPERERMVIFLRFYKGLTQDKTAKIIGTGQVQVSRIERSALKELKKLLD
ncbi:MAG: sigma-70 family RNA polymerase sigma factor [Oscillospiraceae bacterium]|nr:sigma-70 family RNA polymerase sigma factor [Oscillospiraceae bacterium]